MRKTILTIAIALLVGISANAQFYIGGSLYFSNSSLKIEELKNSSQPSYTFSISPEIGYQLNEKTAVGLSLSAYLSSYKTMSVNLNMDDITLSGIHETKRTDFGIAPYVRYSLLKWKKFDLLGMAQVYMNAGTTEYDHVYEDGFYSNNKTKTTGWGARIRPVLFYNVSDKLTLVSHLNFCRLGFSYEKEKVPYNSNENDYTRKTIKFDLDLDTYNSLPSIGFIYKL